MAEVFDYTNGKKVTIENVIKEKDYVALDAGTPAKKVLKLYADIKDVPCVKFDYIFNDNGTFAKGEKVGNVVTIDPSGTDFVVAVYEKFKTMDRLVPGYRTFNAKLLKPGEKVIFNTTNKDEIVFFEKLQAVFDGELKVTFKDITA